MAAMSSKAASELERKRHCVKERSRLVLRCAKKRNCIYIFYSTQKQELLTLAVGFFYFVSAFPSKVFLYFEGFSVLFKNIILLLFRTL
jgi:hypothetical protein